MQRGFVILRLSSSVEESNCLHFLEMRFSGMNPTLLPVYNEKEMDTEHGQSSLATPKWGARFNGGRTTFLLNGESPHEGH